MERHEFKLRQESEQGNLRKFLVNQEDTIRQKDNFFAIMHEAAKNSLAFRVALVHIDGAPYTLVVGKHADIRIRQRTIIDDTDFLARVAGIASHELIGPAIVENPFVIDDGRIHPEAEDDPQDNGTAIVIDEEINAGFVFESGYRFINLLTVFATNELRHVNYIRNGEIENPYKVFKTEAGTKVIKICKGGFLEFRPERIPEVIITDKQPWWTEAAQ